MADPRGALATVAERIDRSVPVADDIGNTVLIDDRHLMRIAGPLFALLAVLLVPWTVFIAVALPSRQLSPNYDLAWAGFDVFLCAGLAATGYFVLRRSRWLPAVAGATAAMLVVDAWFDVVTSPSGRDLAAAIVLAVVVELPLAALCVHLARQGQLVNDKRLAVLLAGRGSSTTGTAAAVTSTTGTAARGAAS